MHINYDEFYNLRETINTLFGTGHIKYYVNIGLGKVMYFTVMDFCKQLFANLLCVKNNL